VHGRCGASAGVGRALAHRFARAGARLGLIARDAEALREVASEIESLGGTAIVAPADVADADQVFGAADLIRERLGPADIWINDAMATVFAPVCRITPEEFRRVTDVTYLGTVHGTMAALRQMRPRNRGALIQVGSALAYPELPSNPLTAAQSTRFGVLRIRYAASSFTRIAASR